MLNLTYSDWQIQVGLTQAGIAKVTGRMNYYSNFHKNCYDIIVTGIDRLGDNLSNSSPSA